MNNISKTSKIYVAGHRGMVGSAIVRALKEKGFDRIITRTHRQLDLTCQKDVRDFFTQKQPDLVFLAAAKVGGIHANSTLPADFIYENLMIQANVLDAAFRSQVKQLLFLGSSCIYPRLCTQPMKENALMTGPLEPTNEPYAIAKIAGIKMCESYNRQHGTRFRSVMPTNLYGEYDNFHPENSHVIPGLTRRFHDTKINKDKIIVIWGTGNVRREFLHVDDMARACLSVMNLPEKEYQVLTRPTQSHINIGSGKDISIKELAYLIKKIVGYQGDIVFDPARPEGPPEKRLDVHLMKQVGYKPVIELRQGIEQTYKWFLKHRTSFPEPE